MTFFKEWLLITSALLNEMLESLTSHLSCIGKADVSWKGRAATKI